MHELSVAESILDVVRQAVPAGAIPRVRAIRVRIGDASGVEPEALTFCFGAIVSGTDWAPAVLDVEPVPATGACLTCGARFPMRMPVATCPSCGDIAMCQIGGTDLQVVDVTLADEESVA